MPFTTYIWYWFACKNLLNLGSFFHSYIGQCYLIYHPSSMIYSNFQVTHSNKKSGTIKVIQPLKESNTIPVSVYIFAFNFISGIFLLSM